MAPPNPLPPWYEDARTAQILLRRVQNFLSIAVHDGCPAKEILSKIDELSSELTILVLSKGKSNAR